MKNDSSQQIVACSNYLMTVQNSFSFDRMHIKNCTVALMHLCGPESKLDYNVLII